MYALSPRELFFCVQEVDDIRRLIQRREILLRMHSMVPGVLRLPQFKIFVAFVDAWLMQFTTDEMDRCAPPPLNIGLANSNL
jgi:hypothetical protein